MNTSMSPSSTSMDTPSVAPSDGVDVVYTKRVMRKSIIEYDTLISFGFFSVIFWLPLPSN